MRDLVPVTIDGLTADGEGTGLDPRGRRWVVAGAPPGAVVLAGGRARRGVRLGLAQPSPDAVAPACPAFGACGGCQLQEMPLARQRAEKARAVARILAGLGGVERPIVGAEGGYGYRNKMELSFGAARYLDGDELRSGVPRAGRWLGLHAAGRFDKIVDLAGCPLMEPAMEAVYRRARAAVLASPFPVWDNRAFTGFWRYLRLRAGLDGVHVALYTARGGEAEAAWIAAEVPGLGASGWAWFESDRTGEVATGPRRLFGGSQEVRVRLGGVEHRLDPDAFFQVNTAGAEVLLGVIGALAGEGGLLLDLYGGTGAIGLALAGRFSAVFGVERHPGAVEAAERTAAAHGIPATFLVGDVEGLLDRLPQAPDVVIVDPPRNGLHAAALGWLARVPARVLVYVACRPGSLARDGAALVAAGWRCTDWQAVDLFPQTGHVEVVARFVRETGAR